jgi:hypothetical protein
MSSDIIASMITGGSLIVSAILGAFVANRITEKKNYTRQVESDLEEARADIEFLLAVERRHCELNRARGEAPGKFKARDWVRSEKGLVWSGKHTPGRVINP